MNSTRNKIIFFLVSVFTVIFVDAANIKVNIQRPTLPVLAQKNINPTIRLDIKNERKENFSINEITISLEGTKLISDIVSVGICRADKRGFIDTANVLFEKECTVPRVIFNNNISVSGDSISLWIFVKTKDEIDLKNRIHISCPSILIDKAPVPINDFKSKKWLRTGIALRKEGLDGVAKSRIPGLVTSKKGTLLAIYDARWESVRDLQGNMDIALQRSFDEGRTWQPMQIIIDMGEWGGLPQKYNGVSDACILIDDVTSDIYVISLWMHGILDKETGKWVEGLNAQSEQWTHQWIGRGSQPGLNVKQTSQILMVKSSDDGLTWSKPVNITKQVKRPEWWLFAPAPGHGITLKDGTLVFPSQGRDENGLPFSNIMWSKDRGKTWKTSNPAHSDVTECMAVELTDGRVMLNMRDNRNKKNKEINGRRVSITSDLGETWIEHPTSRKALIEPTCMGSIHRHTYTKNGGKHNVLLFSNPNSKLRRERLTIKASLDDGMTWPKKQSIMLDEYRGWAYSCITSIDENTIGILYESSQADMVFQQIEIKELIHK
ncbi:sialidase family protein [Dysgonomonas sp. BGC7]|uniref:sialidase family protein n=1 Tax=Dysgonomonas sp. BGC7 TaxID=1658008 RepID=UPI0006810056|nr:sialidase family protein [Dysgonomonas sp. BGC7]MBD8389113.1 exo-alpha-sialidase [Dysgonomonas sp. BGC7]